MIRLLLLFTITLHLLHCENIAVQEPQSPADQAQVIVDKAIAAHGGTAYDQHTITFEFRGRQYKSARNGGAYTYERSWQDTTGQQIRDVLSNDGFTRFTDDKETVVEEKKAAAYSRSVNSVIYFVLLPYFLNDPAVYKTYLGEVTLKDQSYHKLLITFEQEGGGRDFEDQFIYWIHKDRYTMDYLAYNYKVDGGGARFREAYNVRTIEGIRFADYINYKAKDESLEVKTFDDKFEAGEMVEVSRIDSENVKVVLGE